ncbi:hypothetical protein PFICI_09468 [Pestalotiopsis fici W106-1]|uniref:RBR-type E3 ubiquitin transferase n=1 Tax=Pestalotiopsis fici (strain W106-1 / CGMCC3.15140) TaxID=1229662 RepID=W3X0J3_PESFW|nr:uncharacterized protein PFICI_09468 [Pestalotiopsis fici W106-1]ETS79615.1 hypothetical protein PFICI_09468 [Pestalotiopsis fici W106-1]
MDDEDARAIELSSITAIYHEELKLDEKDPYSFTIELSLSLSRPLTVKFPAPAEAVPLIPGPEDAVARAVPQVDSQQLLNLPSLQIYVTLPEGYPENKPPAIKISTSPPWLPAHIVKRLEGRVEELWEDMGRDQVIFTYVDDVQQSVDDVFGLVDQESTLEVGPEHKIAILDYDLEAKKRTFQRSTFDCGICLDPKKGLACHRMLDCGHVFCVQCLQDFYNNAITEGDIVSVQCLEPGCASEREKAARQANPGKSRKFKAYISPSELLQIPIEQDMVKRYVALKHKAELESDKNTVYCPRPWCQGAARSKKHKKPEGLDFAESSDDDSEDEIEGGGDKDPAKRAKFSASKELLAICEDCGFAFCSRCGQSWHGEFKYCIPKERKEEITEEEKASLEYLRMHTTPCPTCAAPCQKTQGCNHMRCFRCQSHFCYLCSAWLNPENPYQHFNTQPGGEVNSCYMRLWELEGGDGNDVGIAYQGGNAIRNPNIQPGEYGQHLEIVGDVHRQEPELEIDRGRNPVAEQHQQGQDQPQGIQPGGGVAVAREGPLVLRIEGDAPPARGRPGRQQAPPAARGGNQAVNGAGQRGRGRGGNRGGRPGAGGNRARGQNQRGNRAGRNDDHNIEHEGEAMELNQADEVWVRHFIELALNDQEHLLLEGDSGDEDD